LLSLRLLLQLKAVSFIFQKMIHQDFSNQDYYILTETMRKYGGHFMSKLADAICVADLTNKKKLIDAFPEVVTTYGPGSRFAEWVIAGREKTYC